VSFKKDSRQGSQRSTGCDARNSCPDCRVRIQIQEIDAAFRAAVRDEILGAPVTMKVGTCKDESVISTVQFRSLGHYT